MGNYKTGSGNYKSSYLINIIKQVDETIQSSAMFHNDNDFKFEGKANRVYTVVIYLLYSSGSVPDFKYTWSVPSGATGKALNGYFNSNTDFNTQDIDATETIQMASGVRATNTWGSIVMGSVSGTCNFQWAQLASDPSDTTVYTGSMLVINEN